MAAKAGYRAHPGINPIKANKVLFISNTLVDPANAITKKAVTAAASPKSCDCQDTNPVANPNRINSQTFLLPSLELDLCNITINKLNRAIPGNRRIDNPDSSAPIDPRYPSRFGN